MALSLGSANWRLRTQAPATRLASPQPKRAPIWPTVSIVFLVTIPSLVAPIVPTVLNATLVSIVAIIMLIRSTPIDRRLVVIGALVASTAILGLITGVGADRYEYFKDLWYIANPFLVILTGYILYSVNPNVAVVLRAFVIAGVLVGLWHLRHFVLDPTLLTLSTNAIRQIVGHGSSVPVLALTILLVFSFATRTGVKLGRAWWIILVVILSLAVASMFSRTAVALLIVAMAATLGCFVRREWLRVFVPAVFIVFISALTATVFDIESDQAVESFGGKMLRSIQEMTAVDELDLRSINLNFRAYETNRVLEQFASSPTVNMLIGQGFGATVDLGVTMPLSVTETGYRGVRNIGLFHNGYMYLLTKVGMVGLILYGSLLAYLYWIPRSRGAGSLGRPEVATARLFQAAVVSMIVTTYFVGGVFNREGMFAYLLLIGCLLAHVRRLEQLPQG